SSLVNAILNVDRVIVRSMGGTTSVAMDTPFRKDEQESVITDKVRVRKKDKVNENTEKESVIRAKRDIGRKDGVLVVIDAEIGIREQDKASAGYAHEAGRGIVVVVNKWDTVNSEDMSTVEFEKLIREQFVFLDYAPIIFLSAKTKKRIQRLIPTVKLVSESHSKRVPTNILNDVISDALAINPTPTVKGQRLKV